MRKLLALMGLVFSLNLAAADYMEGQHYFLLGNPVPVADKTKVEVVELFSYHCGHCFHFEPLIKPWKAKQTDDVIVKQMPAFWNPQLEPWVRGYYTAVVLGIVDKTHQPVFNSFILGKMPLNNADEWINFYTNYGKTREQVSDVYNSLAVTSYASVAKSRLMNNYKADSTPELYVQGKYRIHMNDYVKSQEDMLKIADFLIAEERKSLKK
jgi:protein dithiol oxidoreductase (disulfide-forming)